MIAFHTHSDRQKGKGERERGEKQTKVFSWERERRVKKMPRKKGEGTAVPAAAGGGGTTGKKSKKKEEPPGSMVGSYQHYRRSAVGEALAQTIEEMSMQGKMSGALAEEIESQFDKSIAEALRRRATVELEIGGKLRMYRQCDLVWTWVVEDAKFIGGAEEYAQSPVKIVACDGGPPPDEPERKRKKKRTPSSSSSSSSSASKKQKSSK